MLGVRLLFEQKIYAATWQLEEAATISDTVLYDTVLYHT